ncbi:MAG: methyltransferase domain-containing protein [Planctomycetes bacterium]|nr:methyltransferase domain-containing protein [Planctomycetota bacterium]
MVGRILHRIRRKLRVMREPEPESILPLRRPLTLPSEVAERELRSFLAGVRPAGAPPEEMARYCQEDFERFVLTWQLTEGLTGDCLELGANPYFTTMLLRRFSRLALTLANYFGPHTSTGALDQEVVFPNWETGRPDRVVVPTHHFNVEKDPFPFADAEFDVVLFCEILEHLLENPLQPLLEIGRVLKPGGVLILTTPNVARLENIARLLAGENIYDPYSAYGPYGRHNREYTMTELKRLLGHAGFSVEKAFSADVHANQTNVYFSVSKLAALVDQGADLGQYLFIRARKVSLAKEGRPNWLFRSYLDH